MLRGIRHPYLDPRIEGYQFNVSGASAGSLSINPALASSATVSSSRGTAVMKFPSARNRVTVGTAVDTAQKWMAMNASPTKQSLVHQLLDNSGNNTTGKTNLISLGWNSTNTNRIYPYSSVKGMACSSRIIGGVISSTGSILVGKNDIASVSKASSVYTITFKRPFARTPVVVASCYHGSAHKTPTVVSEAANQIQIKTWASGSAEDNAFCFIVYGWDLALQSYGNWQVVRCGSVAPRIEAIYVAQAAGTYTSTIGGASIVKNGTGDVSVTFAKAFKRAPAVVVSGVTKRAGLLAQPTTTGFRFGGFAHNNAATAAEDEFCALVLGWDHTVEN